MNLDDPGITPTELKLILHELASSSCPDLIPVIESSRIEIYESGWDGWDGGTKLFTADFHCPASLISPHLHRVGEFETSLNNLLTLAFRTSRGCSLSEVRLGPVASASGQDHIFGSPSQTELTKIWKSGFRLFLSHKSKYKIDLHKLREQLTIYGISAFVAHENNLRGKVWRKTILSGLSTCQALVAIVTPDFHDSEWTDQEIGFALGRSIPVLPVCIGADPKGFLGDIQGARCNFENIAETAHTITSSLLEDERIQRQLQSGIIHNLEKVGFTDHGTGYANAGRCIDLLHSYDNYSTSEIEIMIKACESNSQLSQHPSTSKTEMFLGYLRSKLPAVAPPEDEYDPFAD
jgi:hypothetical protein